MGVFAVKALEVALVTGMRKRDVRDYLATAVQLERPTEPLLHHRNSTHAERILHAWHLCSKHFPDRLTPAYDFNLEISTDCSNECVKANKARIIQLLGKRNAACRKRIRWSEIRYEVQEQQQLRFIYYGFWDIARSSLLRCWYRRPIATPYLFQVLQLKVESAIVSRRLCLFGSYVWKRPQSVQGQAPRLSPTPVSLVRLKKQKEGI